LKSEAEDIQGTASVLKAFDLRLPLSARRAAATLRAMALGQQRPQISGGDYKPSEIFIDSLALLLERIEHIAESLPHIVHAQSFSRSCW